MIKVGYNGGSRGNFDTGVMLGADICTLISLSIYAINFEDNLITNWAKDWMGTDFTAPSTAEGWFSMGHQAGKHFWALPPAGALIALEELAQ